MFFSYKTILDIKSIDNKREMLTCAFKTQVNVSNNEIVYWNVCIIFNF